MWYSVKPLPFAAMVGLDQTVKNPISNLEIVFLRIVLSKIKCVIFMKMTLKRFWLKRFSITVEWQDTKMQSRLITVAQKWMD